MRKIYRHTVVISTAILGAIPALTGSIAHAQANIDQNGQPIFLPNTSSSYNQQGFNLPSAPSRSGQDIVRGSGGISCQSAINSGGPQLDMGVIGTNDIFNRESAALYGRITMPLGKRPKRVDCTKLYDLEIARLKMELKLMRAGAMMMEDEGSARNMLQSTDQNQGYKPKIAEVEDDDKGEFAKPLSLGAPPKSASTMATSESAKLETVAVSKNVNTPIRTAPLARAKVASPSLGIQRPTQREQTAQAQPAQNSGVVSIANYGDVKTNSGYYAQIGAYSTIENAKEAWWKYTKNVPGGFTNYAALAKPKRGVKRTLYLLQAGPFTKQGTKTLCDSIGDGCYAFRR